MAHVVFFEKPGCANNARQKAWLAAAGHQVEARDLLTHPWSAVELRSFLGGQPVRDWFNRAAPRIKSGELRPESLGEDAALAALVAEPLLIRRPLLLAEGRREAGFDVERVHAWLGLPEAIVAAERARDAEACLRRAAR